MQINSGRIALPTRKFKDSLRAKLFAGSLLLMGSVLAIGFASILVLDSRRSRLDLARAESGFREAIYAKGARLTMNNSIVLASLAEENSVSVIREILDNIVASDPDIVYGAYMDTERRPWAYRGPADSAGMDPRLPLTDSMSLWASGIGAAANRARTVDGIELIEFAVPVKSGEKDLGRFRIGLSTRNMHAAIRETTEASREARRHTLAAFSGIAVITCILAVLASTYLAQRITRPITALTVSASRMAQGEYGAGISAVGTDEISVLAGAFETMRLKIRDYMENLQMLVEYKVRQVKDILENIDQGLFTFGLDMRINEDCSRKAKHLLQAEDMAGRALGEVLKLDPHKESLFRDWVEIVRESHARQRWHKLSKLAPVRELQTGEGESARYLRLEYQKILDKQDRLANIMVIVQDVTESRIIERRMREEKIRHDHRVRTILGVASHTQETIGDFLKDSAGRLHAMRNLLEAVRDRLGGTDSEKAASVGLVFRECHTIKGNAGAFGFDALTQVAQDLETLLGFRESDQDAPWSPARLSEMERLLVSMSGEIEKIREIHLLLSGNSEEVSVKLPEKKVARIRELAESAGNQILSPEMLILVESCKRLSYRSLVSLSRKYQDLVARAASKLGKSVEFTISPRNVEVDPGALFRVDEALTHLLRNAVAHGIEEPDLRNRLRKGPGKVDLSYSRVSGSHIFMVRDDGQGVDTDTLADKAVALGLISLETAARFGEKEKLNLVFHPGLSATAVADTLSGRGLGMSIANEALRALGGSLAVETRRGSGTCWILSIPA